MSALMSVMILLVVLLGFAVVALSYRLWKLRQGGTAAIMRDIPAVGGHGWRHGVIRYRGADAVFYRLSSVRLWPDRKVNRRGGAGVSWRPPRGYEIAADREALTAFQSWLESRPSPRARRRTT